MFLYLLPEWDPDRELRSLAWEFSPSNNSATSFKAVWK